MEGSLHWAAIVTLEDADFKCEARAKTRGREISLCAGRRIRRSECGRKNRPAPFEMTGWRRGCATAQHDSQAAQTV
jgi:hypothetical protein